MGYCPIFFKLESQYNKLYCDRLGRGAHGQARTRPSLPAIRSGKACNTAETWAYDTAGPRARASRSCVRAWLLGDWVAIQKLYRG